MHIRIGETLVKAYSVEQVEGLVKAGHKDKSKLVPKKVMTTTRTTGKPHMTTVYVKPGEEKTSNKSVYDKALKFAHNFKNENPVLGREIEKRQIKQIFKLLDKKFPSLTTKEKDSIKDDLSLEDRLAVEVEDIQANKEYETRKELYNAMKRKFPKVEDKRLKRVVRDFMDIM